MLKTKIPLLKLKKKKRRKKPQLSSSRMRRKKKSPLRKLITTADRTPQSTTAPTIKATRKRRSRAWAMTIFNLILTDLNRRTKMMTKTISHMSRSSLRRLTTTTTCLLYARAWAITRRSAAKKSTASLPRTTCRKCCLSPASGSLMYRSLRYGGC